MRKPIFFVSGGLDRAAERRRDDAWLAEVRADNATRYVPYWRGKNLLREAGDSMNALVIGLDQLSRAKADPADAVLLGVENEVAFFASELDGDDPLATLAFDAGITPQFHELRSIAARLTERDATLLSHAKGMLYWHARHKFCGVCGSRTMSTEAGHVRKCTNQDCQTSHFPRTDSAVIMLVASEDRVLLGRQAVWPPGMYSVLAGFVEPGETLEAAVAREVLEESGIEVEDIRYQGSQPWPFPGSIMLGFRARATTTEIRADPEELQDARWVTRQWLRDNPNDPNLRVPPGGAIARRMVEDWIAEGDG